MHSQLNKISTFDWFIGMWPIVSWGALIHTKQSHLCETAEMTNSPYSNEKWWLVVLGFRIVRELEGDTIAVYIDCEDGHLINLYTEKDYVLLHINLYINIVNFKYNFGDLEHSSVAECLISMLEVLSLALLSHCACIIFRKPKFSYIANEIKFIFSHH